MNNISNIVGERIRTYRNRLNLSQETLAEKCKLHPTYIGQLERGEKKPSIETIEKVCRALNISMDLLFKNIVTGNLEEENAIECYNLISKMPKNEQPIVVNLIKDIVKYKNM